SSPSALASRLAGSTVSTSTLPPRWVAAEAPIAAAVVVLPTPPEPVDTTTSLAEHSCSIVAGATTSDRSVMLREAIRTPTPRPGPRRCGPWRAPRGSGGTGTAGRARADRRADRPGVGRGAAPGCGAG